MTVPGEDRSSDAPVMQRVEAPPLPRARRRRIWLFVRIGLLGVVLAGVSVLATPLVMMRSAKQKAMACIAKLDQPRGPRLPDCSAPIPEMSKLARVSYVHHDATYRAEELWSRIMMAEYENASVGSPEPSLRAQTAGFVDEAETVVGKGSQRIQLDELGPIVSAPHLGKLAASLGDRRTLIEHFDWWTAWPVRVHAMQAALIEGDLAKAGEMARRYYDWDPRDPDVRTMMGAVLCLGSDPGRGLELLTRVPADRADKRYAAIARNYGEVLAVMEACAKKANVDAPMPPQVSHAGAADVEEARLVQDIRFAKLRPLVQNLGDKAITMLQEERGFDSSQAGVRAFLLAAIVAYDDRTGARGSSLTPAVLANLATIREHEPTLGPPLGLTPRDVLDEPPGVVPVLPREALARAAARLEKLAEDAVPSKEAPNVDPKGPLYAAAAAISTYAAIASARAGDADAAQKEIDTAGRLARAPERTIHLASATLAYVAGDPKRALERLGQTEGDDPSIEAECAIVAALAHASLGEREAALADATRASTLAAKNHDVQATLDARWLDLAFGDAPKTSGALEPPVFTGMADPLARWETIGAPALDSDLHAWRAAMGANDDEKLGFRYALMKVRGDAPRLAIPYLIAASRLLREGATGPSTEVWLDAVSAIDAPRMPISAYVFSRREAARARGDQEAAAAWDKRLEAVRAMKSSEPDLEIARFIGL